MNWLNLKTSQLREPSFIGSDPVARATWLCVMAYCVEMENSGRIVGARLWKDRQWQQTCGVMLSEIQTATLLLSWVGDDLIVWNYPSEKEVEVRDRREVAKKNGKKGGRPPKEDSTEKKTDDKPTSVSENNQRPKAEGEGEGEGKGKEKGKPPEEPPTPPAAAPRGVSEGKDSSMIPTTDQSKRIATVFHRRLETPWTVKEVAAYKRLGTIPETDLAAVEAYYAANWPPRRDVNILRHDLLTFLNNFQGEVDRAHAAKTKPKVSRANEWPDSRPKIEALPDPAETERIRAEALRMAKETQEQLRERTA